MHAPTLPPYTDPPTQPCLVALSKLLQRSQSQVAKPFLSSVFSTEAAFSPLRHLFCVSIHPFWHGSSDSFAEVVTSPCVVNPVAEDAEGSDRNAILFPSLLRPGAHKHFRTRAHCHGANSRHPRPTTGYRGYFVPAWIRFGFRQALFAPGARFDLRELFAERDWEAGRSRARPGC